MSADLGLRILLGGITNDHHQEDFRWVRPSDFTGWRNLLAFIVHDPDGIACASSGQFYDSGGHSGFGRMLRRAAL